MTIVWSPCGVVINVLNCDITVNKFELQLCYNVVHFQTKRYKLLYPPPLISYGLISSTIVFLQG